MRVTEGVELWRQVRVRAELLERAKIMQNEPEKLFLSGTALLVIVRFRISKTKIRSIPESRDARCYETKQGYFNFK